MSKLATVSGLMMLVACASVASVETIGRAHHYSNWLNIFAPYNGTWNKYGYIPQYNVDPAVHHHPFGGQWGTDYYAPHGTAAGFRLANSIPGGIAYGVVSIGVPIVLVPALPNGLDISIASTFMITTSIVAL